MLVFILVSEIEFQLGHESEKTYCHLEGVFNLRRRFISWRHKCRKVKSFPERHNYFEGKSIGKELLQSSMGNNYSEKITAKTSNEEMCLCITFEVFIIEESIP